jgi:hypothetical protein
MGSASPLQWLAVDDFHDKSFADALAASYPSFDEAVTSGHAFNAVNENLKVQVSSYAVFPDAAKRLADALSSDEFLGDLAYVTGIEKLQWDPTLAGGGLHETARSGWLDVHVDFNFHEELQMHRRLNILVYLNPLWEEPWGGVLELWDKDVQRRHHAFVPVHNRCVLFETNDISFHGVTAVTCPPGTARKSFAAYYYTREAPAGWDGSKHSTIFKARPDEYMKRHVLMPAEVATQSLREGVRSAKGVVRRMFKR